jgi:hypothetical protein
MDSIQEQVMMLTSKVDALHQMIDQVNGQVANILALAHPHSLDDSDLMINDSSYDYVPHHAPSALDFVSEHKDILVDSSYLDLERHSNETTLSKDVQIQRLTAQLTAAYNRIAALEEQLLAARVH